MRRGLWTGDRPVKRLNVWIAATAVAIALIGRPAFAADPAPETPPAPKIDSGDTAWMLASSALVMFMMPGLALFYGGMVRRKNVLATMMQTMVALSIVGVFWVLVGYNLAFGNSVGGVIGWSPKLLFLRGVEPGDVLPNSGIPVYVHVM